MNAKLMLSFLREVAANNNREWFQSHRKEYDAARHEFERGMGQAILNIGQFDASVTHMTPKDAVFRFYRDIRFSPDKSPYKRHFGGYVSAKGKKSLHGGYYIHVQPGNCFIAVGSYWLPTNILTSCRNEIMANIGEWRKAVENSDFVEYFGRACESEMSEYTDCDGVPEKGFGISCLKKAPKDFPSDYEFLDYLRLKDYCCWHKVDDGFFDGDGWIVPTMRMFRVAKSMMDFTNAVIDDYE